MDAFAFDPAERPLTDLLTLDVDRALIMLHGRGGEDGSMQGALQLLKILYTGSRVLGSALAMDKIHTKQVWQSLGLPTAKYEIADKRHFEAGKCSAIMDKLGNEVMVKPAREGSSIGMARVTSAKQLETAIQDAFKYDNQVLLEQYIDGPEFTVSVLQGRLCRLFACLLHIHSTIMLLSIRIILRNITVPAVCPKNKRCN